MSSERYRSEVTRAPTVRIGVGRSGLTTSVGWEDAPTALSASGLAIIGDPSRAGPLPTDRFLIPGTRMGFGGGRTCEMTSPGLASFKALLVATSQRRRQIVDETARAKRQLLGASIMRGLGWATLASAILPAIRKSAERAVVTRRQEVASLQANLAKTSIRVDFNIESEVGAPHRSMQKAFDDIAQSSRIWTLRSTQQIDRVRARATYDTVVDRTPTLLGRGAHPLVATSELPPAITVLEGRATAYFYPGFVMVADKKGLEFALIDLADLQATAVGSRFTEGEAVPSDAELIGKAWAKANKDGSRDRRFAHNMQLPVCLYGEVQLIGPGGLNERLIASRAEPCAKFVRALNDLRAILASARTLDGQPRKAIKHG